MADYGGAGRGASLRDALNQLYPLTNLGGIATGFPPGVAPPRVGVTAPRVPPQAGGPAVPPVPPVPGPTGAVPPVPGAPPNPQDDQAQATLQAAQQGDPRALAILAQMQQGQGPPNYAAGLGIPPASFNQRFPGPAMRPLGTNNVGPSMDSAFSNVNDEYPLGIALREKARSMK